MVISFDNIEEQRIHEFKGGKGDTVSKMRVDKLGKIMLGRLAPGCSIGLHTHETNSEIIYILSGNADFIYDDSTEKAAVGECHYCPKGHSHSMINNGNKDLVFFAVVPEQ